MMFTVQEGIFVVKCYIRNRSYKPTRKVDMEAACFSETAPICQSTQRYEPEE
jgi:hypothetical protein